MLATPPSRTAATQSPSGRSPSTSRGTTRGAQACHSARARASGTCKRCPSLSPRDATPAVRGSISAG
eukprot:5801464-Prymnesium_polylepis.1